MRSNTFLVTASAGGNSVSPVYVTDLYAVPFNVGGGVIVTGSAGYTVQHTFNDPSGIDLNTNAAVTWFNNTYLSNQIASGDFNYAAPVTGIRLLVSAATTATATLQIIQTGPIG